MSAIERSDSDSWPTLCATAIFSAIRGVASSVTVEKVWTSVLPSSSLLSMRWSVASTRTLRTIGLGDLERRAVAAARDFLGQDDVDTVAREDEAGDAAGRGDGDRDGAHARAERRGEEAAIARADQRAAGQRLAGGDRIADDGAEQLGDIDVRAALRCNRRSGPVLRPGLDSARLSASMMVPTGKRLARNQHFGPDGNGRRGRWPARCAGSGEHVLGHDCGDCRDDQRSDQQRDFLNVHGAIASPTRVPQ